MEIFMNGMLLTAHLALWVGISSRVIHMDPITDSRRSFSLPKMHTAFIVSIPRLLEVHPTLTIFVAEVAAKDWCTGAGTRPVSVLPQ